MAKNLIEFYRSYIIEKLALMKGELSDLRYKIYVQNVTNCSDPEELVEMAELDLQIDMAEYVKGVKERLANFNIGFDDAIRASKKIDDSLSEIGKIHRVDLSDDVEEDEDIGELLNDDEVIAAMAMALQARLINEPYEETHREELMRIQDDSDDITYTGEKELSDELDIIGADEEDSDDVEIEGDLEVLGLDGDEEDTNEESDPISPEEYEEIFGIESDEDEEDSDDENEEPSLKYEDVFGEDEDEEQQEENEGHSEQDEISYEDIFLEDEDCEDEDSDDGDISKSDVFKSDELQIEGDIFEGIDDEEEEEEEEEIVDFGDTNEQADNEIQIIDDGDEFDIVDDGDEDEGTDNGEIDFTSLNFDSLDFGDADEEDESSDGIDWSTSLSELQEFTDGSDEDEEESPEEFRRRMRDARIQSMSDANKNKLSGAKAIKVEENEDFLVEGFEDIFGDDEETDEVGKIQVTKVESPDRKREIKPKDRDIDNKPFDDGTARGKKTQKMFDALGLGVAFGEKTIKQAAKKVGQSEFVKRPKEQK